MCATWTFDDGMKALVLGSGKSGLAAEALLKEQGYAVDFAEGYDLVVASPGMTVKSELQLGCEELRRRGWKLLAVTGSKGKSSVVKIVADAIGGVPCGNYGTPVSSLFEQKPGWAVVEVSSFQLETTTLAPTTFEAAVVLNLQEDHLDRHGSVAVYHGLKRKLLGMTVRPFGVDEAATDERSLSLIKGSYFDNAVLRGNGLAAVELMRIAGLDDQSIAKAFRDFAPLPHRMNVVAEIGGVRYIDDSKATSLAALVAGVEMAGGSEAGGGPNVRLIAGGLSKGDDPKSALPILTKRVKKVYLIGRCAELYSLAWKSSVECEICETMERAVERVMHDAESGDKVLLSPGTASFDQFKGFGERGEVFAQLVKKGKKE